MIPATPTDRFIMRVLSDGALWTVHALEQETGYEGSTIKRHLRVLEQHEAIERIKQHDSYTGGSLPSLYRLPMSQ